MIQLGEKSIDSMYVGNKMVKQAYIGSKKVYPDYAQIPSAIKEAMVLWYDIGRQGCTNSNMASNSVLRDLSGNGYDATCYNFAWTTESGITEDNALVSDGVDDYVRVSGLPIMTSDNGYTVITRRQWLDTSSDTSHVFVTKRQNSGAWDGAFTVEYISSGGTRLSYSFGAGQSLDPDLTTLATVYQTSESYNGEADLGIGELTDTDTLSIFNAGYNTTSAFSSVALYSLLLFNRDLTTDEIEWVKTNLIEDNTVEDDWYGVEYYTTSPYPDCIRIGNMSLHQSLPIQSEMRGVFLNIDGNVDSSLPSGSWEGQDRSESQENDVMIVIPDHYVKFETDGDIRRVKMSTKALPGFTKIPKYYVSAYEATLDRGGSDILLRSIVSTDTSCRGGNNSSTNDSNGASLLGKPSTLTSRTNFRTYARNRATDLKTSWNILTYSAYKDIFWLFVVEYATLNTQKAYNADKDDNGYAQGGLGNGVTTLNWNRWVNFNSYNPVIPCGYTDSLGNGTGVVSYTMPFEYDGCTSSSTTVATAYVGEYDASTAYNDGDYVSSGDDLYECIADAGAGTALTNTTYFSQVTRTTVSVPRYRGIENPFGHIWKWVDGINIIVNPDTADGGDGLSKVYTCDTPSLFSDSSYDNYDYIGDEARENSSYVKEIIFGDKGDIIPSVTGGSSTTYFCDSHTTSIPTSTSVNGVLVGGNAIHGSNAGFAYVSSSHSPSTTSAHLGSRLCFIPE